MKYTFLAALIFLSCASTKPPAPVTPVKPPPVVVAPPVDPDTVRQIIHDTVTKDSAVFIHDTTTIRDTTTLQGPIVTKIDTLPVLLPTDTVIGMITLTPSGGDDWANLAATISYCVAHHIYWIQCTSGFFQFPTKPPLIADTTGGSYNQVSIGIRGVCPAKNTIATTQTNFLIQRATPLGIGAQLCKGCTIENIALFGQYTKPLTFTETQIDTLSFAAWSDSICSTNNSSPYAGIAIDPFSNPSNYDGIINKMYAGLEGYYLPTLTQSGSTAVTVKNCSIQNFIVGFIIAPGWTENGEEIDFLDNSVQNCRSVYCSTNGQQKSNRIQGLQVWGRTHTIIDLGRYGAHLADGAFCPTIDGVNMAFWNHQFINGYANAHPIHARNVYAEQLYKIGSAGGPGGTSFEDCEFNLQLPDPGTPFPDFVIQGPAIQFSNTLIRAYGDSMRLVLNCTGCSFTGGTMGNPPVCISQELQPYSIYIPTAFHNVLMEYSLPTELNTNNYDSLVLLGTNVPITVNPDQTGSVIVTDTAGIKSGDLLLTQHVFGDDNAPYEGPQGSSEYPVGVVTSVSGFTVYLRHIGQNLYTGNVLPWVSDARYRVGAFVKVN